MYATLPRRLRPRRRRVAARLAYLGGKFRGFQRQPGQRTVEGALLEALQASGYGEGLGFASRTDAGVHALGQVVAFKVPDSETPEAVQAKVAERLPADITLSSVVWAPPRFHPRWSATGKQYLYRLPSQGLDPLALEQALDELRRAPGLDGFTAAGAPPKPAPPLTRLTLAAQEDAFLVTFEGPAFRRYAIRHMIGCAAGQAAGDLPPGTCSLVAAQPPPYRGARGAADGLTLVEVYYPEGLDPFVP